MPDISMCNNRTCPSRHLCYRYMAIPNPYRQSYAIGLAPLPGDMKCYLFSEIYKGSRGVRTVEAMLKIEGVEIVQGKVSSRRSGEDQEEH